MIACIRTELISRQNYLDKASIQTLYFGGGTPSLLSDEELSLLVRTVTKHFDCTQLCEFTIEANPEDISPERLYLWRQLGVNRLSIGIQSFRNKDLKWMNRIHSAEQAKKSVKESIDSGIKNVSVDLIYGLPNLSIEEWREHVLSVVELGVKHISAYCLTVEQGTALSAWIQKGKIVPAHENIQAEQFFLLVDVLEQHGFVQYEISNFCLPNYESIHNSNYWSGKHYLGVGPSAHSFNGRSRSWNVRNNHVYMQGITNKNPQFESEQLSLIDRYNELLLTDRGVSLEQLFAILPQKPTFFDKVAELCALQLMIYIESEQRITLTKNGRLQADRIASDFFVIE